ncbi:uncharacterized protein PHALS_11461 [Plasmopara halstedii]|uniref:Uncharacterized protein n=1 Tax=Plasmopara halstedii TaxID=4781 RepID=A0A0P1A4X3_PLAHL|nr:uncharacterized protein PHALS_11461 [Plasmopara halstedii]CEG35590.1 hypothetical protein PHALS_11461 [Plasmopara halstedii]|eukprot:XP_024571959.1 hypothetical protein PHALS_11461 [Plasmopara halstedii]
MTRTHFQAFDRAPLVPLPDTLAVAHSAAAILGTEPDTIYIPSRDTQDISLSLTPSRACGLPTAAASRIPLQH